MSASMVQQTTSDDLDELIRTVPVGETLNINSSPMRPSTDVPTVAGFSYLVVDGRVTSLSAEPSGIPYHVSTRLEITINRVWANRGTLSLNPRRAVP